MLAELGRAAADGEGRARQLYRLLEDRDGLGHAGEVHGVEETRLLHVPVFEGLLRRINRASRDATRAIASRGADLVAVRTFDDFASQRNAALEMASGEWVFAIDADERASPELAAEVRKVTSDPALPHNGYRVPIRSIILGRPFRFPGTQFDWPLRLFRRGAGRWVGTVHETVDLDGSHGRLTHALQHRTIPDMRTFLRKINEYTTLEAIKFEREGRLFAVSLKAGAVELLLGQDDGAKGEGRVKGEGFSLQITTTQDVDALAKRIQDRGGLLATEPADMWGARAFRLQDPDGFRLTISSQRS